MHKVILLTGATDGIGFATAEILVKQGHTLLIHGRNRDKLEQARERLETHTDPLKIETYQADLSSLSDTRKLAESVKQNYQNIDVLINNAGVYKTPIVTTEHGLDVRVLVNTIAPYQLTKDLLPLLGESGRVINLSSAAQAPVNLERFFASASMDDMSAYSQSKLAIVMWTRHLVASLENSPTMIAVNPGSLLASKMVKEGFGVAGNDISIGAKIVSSLSVDEQYGTESGKYFDNDKGQFSDPHPAGLNDQSCAELVRLMDSVVEA